MSEPYPYKAEILREAELLYGDFLSKNSEYQDIFHQFVAESLPDLFGLDDYSSFLRSERGILVLEFAKKLVFVLKELNIKAGYDDYPKDYHTAYELLSDIIYSFKSMGENKSLTNDSDHKDLKEYKNLTYVEEFSLRTAFESKDSPIDLNSLAIDTSKYLKSKFRTPFIDRLLFTGLAHGEMGGFFHQYTNKVFKNMPYSPFTLSKLLDKSIKASKSSLLFAFGIFLDHLLICIILYFIWYFFELPYESWKFPMIGIIMFVWLGRVLYHKALRDGYLNDPNDMNKKIVQMLHAFHELELVLKDKSDISIKEVREKLNKAKENGAIFPGVMWVLLDTLERDGEVSLTWQY